jgi:undecaprenyl-diphosphatase
MAGGLLAGLNNEDAARFSFLLATPVIGAAALLKLPEIFSSSYASLRLPMLVGAACAAAAAYVSVSFLMRFFRSNTLRPFALYCLLAGASASLYLLTK